MCRIERISLFFLLLILLKKKAARGVWGQENAAEAQTVRVSILSHENIIDERVSKGKRRAQKNKKIRKPRDDAKAFGFLGSQTFKRRQSALEKRRRLEVLADVRLEVFVNLADRLVAVNAFDRFAEDFRAGKNLNFRNFVFRKKRDRVRKNDAFDRRFLNALDRRAAKDAVRRGDEDFRRAHFFDDASGAADRAAGADHVVEKERDATFDRAADQVRLFDFFAAVATFVDDRQAAAERRNVFDRALNAPGVRADDDAFFRRVTEAHNVVVQNRRRAEMVERNVEEALDLRGVQVHRNDAVSAGAFEEVRGEFRGDRNAAFVFAVLTSVAEVRNDRRNATGARATEAVDHHQEFHQRIVDRAARRLNDEDVFAANVFFNAAEGLAVGELLNADMTRRQTEVIANFFSQRGVGGSGKYL